MASVSHVPRVNALHVLNTLPPDEILKLACAANALASQHVRTVRRSWFWMRDSLESCDVCARSFLRGAPEHADFCPVGRIQKIAAKLIAMAGAGQPDRRKDTAISPSRERSDASGSAGAGRAVGEPTGVREIEPRASFAEPWAWDPKLGVVVDCDGNTVANMILTDLTPMEQEDFGRRIAVCANFCRSVASEELRVLDAAVAAVTAEREAQDGGLAVAATRMQ